MSMLFTLTNKIQVRVKQIGLLIPWLQTSSREFKRHGQHILPIHVCIHMNIMLIKGHRMVNTNKILIKQ